MKIQCPKCLTNYNVNLSPEEMPEEGSKFSCQKCNNQFFLKRRQESSFISLMKNIKDKLDDWDSDINGKASSKDEKDALKENQQENTEKSAKEIDQEADDLLNEILEEEKLEEASSVADQPPLTPETEMATEDVAHEEHEKIIEEAESQQIEETLQESPEAKVEEQPSHPAEEPAAVVETAEDGSGQGDIDKMFEEATSQQLEGSLEEQSPPPSEEAASPDSAQDDIDALWSAALEEASDSTKGKAADSDEKKPDESYTVKSDQFQSDLENLLEGSDQEADASTEETDKKAEAKAETESKTEQLAVPASSTPDDAGETMAEIKEETTAMEVPPSEEEVAATESELSDFETSEAADGMNEEISEEGVETDIEALSESEQEPLKGKILFYKDMVIFFITDKKKVVKFLIPAFLAIFLMSGGGYWYFSKPGDSEVTIAKVDDKETIMVAQGAKKAETTKPHPVKESEPGDRSTVVKEKKEVSAQKRETKQSIIQGATYPVSKGRVRSISIGSIVPVVFSQDETRVMSVNIKLDIDDRRVYEQIKNGFPVFEEKVESIIEKYFEGKFYKEIQFVQEKLRKELHAKLNQIVKGGEIKTVELEDFLIQ